MRYLVLAAALVFIGGMGLLTGLYINSNGVNFVGVLGAGVVFVCGVGVIGAFLHPPRK